MFKSKKKKVPDNFVDFGRDAYTSERSSYNVDEHLSTVGVLPPHAPAGASSPKMTNSPKKIKQKKKNGERPSELDMESASVLKHMERYLDADSVVETPTHDKRLVDTNNIGLDPIRRLTHDRAVGNVSTSRDQSTEISMTQLQKQQKEEWEEWKRMKKMEDAKLRKVESKSTKIKQSLQDLSRELDDTLSLNEEEDEKEKKKKLPKLKIYSPEESIDSMSLKRINKSLLYVDENKDQETNEQKHRQKHEGKVKEKKMKVGRRKTKINNKDVEKKEHAATGGDRSDTQEHVQARVRVRSRSEALPTRQRHHSAKAAKEVSFEDKTKERRRRHHKKTKKSEGRIRWRPSKSDEKEKKKSRDSRDSQE